jgi:hypothetical protein
MMTFINNWQKTDLLAVDLVASCVSHYRGLNKPLKTIYLGAKNYTQFTDWVRYNLEKESRLEEASQEDFNFTFDGVEVQMNSALMGEKMYFDFYDLAQA